MQHQDPPHKMARLRRGLDAQHPSLVPGEWYPVIERNIAALEPYARPGSVWIEIRGRARQLPISILEFGVGARQAPPRLSR